MIELALSFDVEQWDGDSRAAPLERLLRATDGAPTTWFVAEDDSQSTADRYPELLRQVMAAGHEVAAHVHFSTADTARQCADVSRATEKLRALGSPCVSFRGGAHVFHDRLAEHLVRLGYRVDSSAVPGLVREYRTPGGKTYASYGHVWSSSPHWWRPGLLELPIASFPLTSPRSFLLRRFRLPLLLSDPHEYGRRVLELHRAHGHRDLAVVAMGHSSDVEKPGQTDALARSLRVLSSELGIRFVTVATLAEHLVSGALAVPIGPPPGRMKLAIGELSRLGVAAARRVR